jgi:polysaccharide pyruvyl transferase WcaK-like protein
MLSEVSACDIVVAARLHGALLSILMHKPVVAISYNPKVRTLMEELGCSELCLEIGSVTPEALIRVLDDAIERRSEIASVEREAVADWRQMIDKQYRDILSLLNH